MKTCTVCRNVYPQDLHFCPADGASLVASSNAMFPLGEVVNGYRVVDRLATGGFGETFLVEHATTSRRAVMKVLYATDGDVFDRLKREFAFLSKLGEPAFAQVYEFGMAWDSRPFLVMELVQGLTLKDLLRMRGRLRATDALAVGLRLARGLGRLHDAGIIHRDIKPSNVIIPDAAGQPTFDQAKLIDFGVFGLLVQEGSSRLTTTGMVAGTPRYMAPEQIQGLPQSPGTDVYGLALLLVEMLYGRLPFEASTDSAIALMARLAQTDLHLPKDPDVPEPLRALLSRSLSRDPILRPADGAAFAEELVATIPVRDWAFTPTAARVTAAQAEHRQAPGAAPAPPAFDPYASLAPVAAPASPRRRSSRSSGVKQLASPRPMRSSTVWVFIALLMAPLPFVVFFLRSGSTGSPTGGTSSLSVAALLWIAVGIALAAGGILLGNVVRRLARSRMHEVELDAERLLLGLGTKRALSDTIQVEIAQIITRCRELDERLLGVTILKMISEYDTAKESDQRQAALMNVATLLEKLRGRLSPWYARFEKQLAIATSVIGVASGLVSVIAGMVKVAKGHP